MPPTVLKLFDDPTDGRLINNRLFNGMFPIITSTQLSDADKKKLIHLLTLICKKMIGVWRHVDRYNDHQDKEAERVENASASQPLAITDLSDELFLEFDGFLVQFKSTLDYLVKVPTLVLGQRHWGLRTFGDKGAKVTKSLNNLPNDLKHRVAGFSAFLIEQNHPWLESIIEARDKTNHYIEGGIDHQLFCVRKIDGELSVPMWSEEQTISEFLEVAWQNLFRQIESFVALFLSIKLPEPLTVLSQHDRFPDPECPWKVVDRNKLEEMLKRKGCQTGPWKS